MSAESHPGLPDGHLAALAAKLVAASSVQSACQAVVDHLVAAEGLMPSVYLERGGRLRCQAVSGYWQIRDGLPATAGVIGRSFRSGEPAYVPDVGRADGYLAAATDIAAEICVPIRSGGAVVGVLNVESPVSLPESLVGEFSACAEAFGARLEALGGPPVASAAQRLVVHATRLTGLSTVEEIEREILDAARDVSQMSSAMLLRRDAFGRWIPSRAVGPLSTALYEIPRETVAVIESFVAAGTSCYTGTQPDGDVAQGMEALRAAGVESLVALQVAIQGDQWGILVGADAQPRVSATDEVELLELLVAHAASCLRASEAVGELRERAARDPLTGLGHHGTFHEALTAARRRTEVAVLMIDVDGFKAINDHRGHQAGDRVLVEVAAALSSALRRGDELFRIGGDEFAAIVALADEQEALDAGRRLREAAAATGTVTVSVGVAIPLPGEADAAVLARADRALYGVKAAGRDGVSLEG